MSRKEELEREIRELEDKISDLRHEIADCRDSVKHYEEKLDTKQKEFRDEYNAAENDFIRDTAFGASSEDIAREGYECRYRLYDADVQYKEEASDIISNLNHYKNELKELKSELHNYEQDLKTKKNELNYLPYTPQQTTYRESYEEPAHYNYEQDYNNDDTPSYDYKPTVKKPQLHVSPQPRLVQKNDGYKLHRTGLYEYAKLSNKIYKEYTAVEGGYRASVGNTTFDYHNPNDLVISNSTGVPSIDDFKTIFKIEKKSGRMSMPVESISNKEYMARLIIGAFEAGLSIKGNFKLSEKEMQKLNPNTKKIYQEHIRAYELKIAKRQEMINKAFRK